MASCESYSKYLGIVSLLMFNVSGVDFGLVQPSCCECQRQYVETQAFINNMQIYIISALYMCPTPTHLYPHQYTHSIVNCTEIRC